MSDKITIDHIHNNIIINVNSCNLCDMNNNDILEWICKFVHTLEETSLQSGIVGDKKSPDSNYKPDPNRQVIGRAVRRENNNKYESIHFTAKK